MNNTTISKDVVAGFSYVLKNAEGEILDQSEKPLEYLHGHKNIIPGLEKELEGLSIGDSKEVKVLPEHGYGIIHDDLIVAFPKGNFPPDLSLKVGMELETDTEEGPMVFIVREIRENDVLMDGNHPLAGETLHFAVTIKVIREATKEELDHGHVHSGGHHHHH
jgi:FKBP-type peptidyl-prolyl cis-trans isomerase SlyD